MPRRSPPHSVVPRHPPAEFDPAEVTDSFPPIAIADRFVARRASAPVDPPAVDSAPPAVDSAPPQSVPPESVTLEPMRTSPPRIAPPQSGRAGFAEFGPLAELVRDREVTDIFMNGATELWVDRGRGLSRVPADDLGEASLRALAVRLVAAGGRHIDESSPCIDVRLHDGIRVHAVLPPISPHGTLLSIRLPRVERMSVVDLESTGFFEYVPAGIIRRLVIDRRNVLLTGGGGSGKTTALGALLALAHPHDRIVTIEDLAELRIDHPHVVALEARQANLEGAGEIGLVRLVREALRMRPDRLVLGECRGAEIRELLAALNTGHEGGAGTLHANSLEDVPARLEALGALAGLGPTEIARQTVSAIHTVIHLERDGPLRRIAQIGRFAIDSRDRLVMIDVAGRGGPSASRHRG